MGSGGKPCQKHTKSAKKRYGNLRLAKKRIRIKTLKNCNISILVALFYTSILRMVS